MRNTAWDHWLFRFFLAWYSIGVVLLLLDLVPSWLEWANAVYLWGAGLIGAVYLARTYGTALGTVLALIIFFFSMTLEGIGVQYNLFFGSYEYNSDFGMMILGVPLTIGAAWVAIVATSHNIVKYIYWLLPAASRWRRAPGFIFLGGLLVVGIDFVLDPVNYKLQEYWLWNEGGWYYDIPFSNFQGWFIIGILMHALLFFVLRNHSGFKLNRSAYWEPRAAAVYVLMTAMFTILAAAGGLWLAGVIGLVLVIVGTVITVQGNKLARKRRLSRVQ